MTTKDDWIDRFRKWALDSIATGTADDDRIIDFFKIEITAAYERGRRG